MSETKEQRRERYLRDRQLELERKRQWRQANRQQQAVYNRKYRLLKQFGITPEQYDIRLQQQQGVCAICEKNAGPKMLAVDHCHETGEIRGLLCFDCNTAIGKLGDNVAGLTKALAYLLRSPA